MARVCVIGAGAGGLATAARLGAKGHDVTVLERNGSVGGKLRTWRRDGFAFDLGPSLFTLPAVYADLFLKTGRPLEHEVDLQELEPGFRYVFPGTASTASTGGTGTELLLPGSSIGRTTAAIGEQFGAEQARQWKSLMDRAARIWELTRQDILASEITGPGQLSGLAKQPGALRAVAPWLGLHRMARKHLTDPRLVAVMDRYATYSGSLPTKAPGALITIPLVESLFGLWHLGGGLGTLADALQRRVERVGATIRTGVEVTAIEHADAGVTGVRLADGELIAADIVVSDIDSRRLPRLLGRTAPVRAGGDSYSGFALLLALAGRSDGLHHHNVWFPGDYGREFADLRAGRLVSDPAIYVCRPDDPAMAPPGHEAWFVLVNAPRHGDGSRGTVDYSDPELIDRYADRILASLARRGCDVRDRVLWRRIQTPADLGRSDGTGDGAIYGRASHGALSVLRRPRNTADITGLYRVGGTAHPGGGLPLVGMGAEIVAERIGRGDDRPAAEVTARGCSA